MEKVKNRDNPVYIIDGARTPFLKTRMQPGPFSAADLGVYAGRQVAEKYVNPEEFDQVVIGCVGPSEDEANIARIIALRLGCGVKVPAWTVQRNCASGLQAIDSAAQSIANGSCDLVLAGGTEAMSRAPLLLNLEMTRWLGEFRHARDFQKKFSTIGKFRPRFLVPVVALLRGLTDPVVNMNMGQTAEELAYRFSISREEMDEYALQSHQRAMQAYANGDLDEIQAVYSVQGEVYEQDDGVRGDSTLEKLAKLKPVFEKHGNITAGNSSQVTDGAAMVILASEKAVARYHLPVLAQIADIQWSALDPAMMGLGPVYAVSKLLQKNQLNFEDIDQLEINEAFAAQVLACLRAWQDPKFRKENLKWDSPGEIDMARLNPQGGAIAMGHPVGASGARLVLHCAKMMDKYKLSRTVASLCIGGGQGGAILLKRQGA